MVSLAGSIRPMGHGGRPLTSTPPPCSSPPRPPPLRRRPCQLGVRSSPAPHCTAWGAAAAAYPALAVDAAAPMAHTGRVRNLPGGGRAGRRSGVPHRRGARALRHVRVELRPGSVGVRCPLGLAHAPLFESPLSVATVAEVSTWSRGDREASAAAPTGDLRPLSAADLSGRRLWPVQSLPAVWHGHHPAARPPLPPRVLYHVQHPRLLRLPAEARVGRQPQRVRLGLPPVLQRSLLCLDCVPGAQRGECDNDGRCWVCQSS